MKALVEHWLHTNSRQDNHIFQTPEEAELALWRFAYRINTLHCKTNKA